MLSLVLLILFIGALISIWSIAFSLRAIKDKYTETDSKSKDNAKIFQEKDPNDKSRYSDGLW